MLIFDSSLLCEGLYNKTRETLKLYWICQFSKRSLKLPLYVCRNRHRIGVVCGTFELNDHNDKSSLLSLTTEEVRMVTYKVKTECLISEALQKRTVVTNMTIYPLEVNI